MCRHSTASDKSSTSSPPQGTVICREGGSSPLSRGSPDPHLSSFWEQGGGNHEWDLGVPPSLARASLSAGGCRRVGEPSACRLSSGCSVALLVPCGCQGRVSFPNLEKWGMSRGAGPRFPFHGMVWQQLLGSLARAQAQDPRNASESVGFFQVELQRLLETRLTFRQTAPAICVSALVETV